MISCGPSDPEPQKLYNDPVTMIEGDIQLRLNQVLNLFNIVELYMTKILSLLYRIKQVDIFVYQENKSKNLKNKKHGKTSTINCGGFFIYNRYDKNI